MSVEHRSTNQEPMLFIDWFNDQFETVQIPSNSQIDSLYAYARGIRHASTDDEMKAMFGMIENTLRSFNVVVTQLERMKVRMNHG